MGFKKSIALKTVKPSGLTHFDETVSFEIASDCFVPRNDIFSLLPEFDVKNIEQQRFDLNRFENE